MDKQTFLNSLESYLRSAGIVFRPATLVAFVDTRWTEMQAKPDVQHWGAMFWEAAAGEFLTE